MRTEAIDQASGICMDCTASDVSSSGVCDLCFAELGELHSSEPFVQAQVPSTPEYLRFSDVVAEIQALIDIVDAFGDIPSVSDAARRVKGLLDALRDQFLRDLGAPITGATSQPGG